MTSAATGWRGAPHWLRAAIDPDTAAKPARGGSSSSASRKHIIAPLDMPIA